MTHLINRIAAREVSLIDPNNRIHGPLSVHTAIAESRVPRPKPAGAQRVSLDGDNGTTPQVDQDLLRALESLNRRLRRRLYDLSSLFRISVDLTALRGKNRLVHAYLLNVMGLLGAEVGAVLLLSSQAGGTLEAVAVRGLTPEKAKELGELLLEESFSTEHLSLPNVYVHSRKSRLNGRFAQSAEALGVDVAMPLLHQGQWLGVTLIGRGHGRSPLSNADVEMLGLLSNLVAVALTNARMYEQLETMSRTDGLTGLYNHRHFRILLRNEIARADRFGRHLSLAMIDLDHFKNYNDGLGHPAGDRLLQLFGRLLLDSVRCTDFVARYGGEEFCVILPEVSREGARSFCERLRNRIEQHPFPDRHVQPAGRITASIGCATYPDDATTADDLVAKADKALYRAKQAGRNRSMVFEQ